MDATRQLRASHEADIGAEAGIGVVGGAAAAGRGCTTAPCAVADKETRVGAHSAEGDGTEHRGCGQANASVAADNGTEGRPAGVPDGRPRGAAVCEGQASLAVGVDDAFTVSAGQSRAANV